MLGQGKKKAKSKKSKNNNNAAESSLTSSNDSSTAANKDNADVLAATAAALERVKQHQIQQQQQQQQHSSRQHTPQTRTMPEMTFVSPSQHKHHSHSHSHSQESELTQIKTEQPKSLDSEEEQDASALLAAIQGRIQLSSQCIILIGKVIRCLKQQQSSSRQAPQSAAIDQLYQQLDKSVKHCDVTMSELSSFYTQFQSKTHTQETKVSSYVLRQVQSDYESVCQKGQAISHLAHTKLALWRSQQTQSRSYQQTQSQSSATDTTRRDVSGDDDEATSLLDSERQELLSTQSNPASYGALSSRVDDMQSADVSTKSLLQEIESDLTSIHSVFLTLHNLVDQQQATVDSIDEAVQGSAFAAMQGEDELAKAEVYRRKRRRRRCCCTMFVIALLLVLILAVYIVNPSTKDIELMF